MAEREIERRRSKRFEMEMRVTVKTQDGKEQECATRDISAGGVFLFCQSAVGPNSPVQLVMILPPEITGERGHWVCGHGRVVRVVAQSAGGQCGIAIKMERIVFLPEITA